VWLGYLVRPDGAAAGGVLALRVGLAVVGALSDLGVSTQLKWPNDVMLRDRKLAGVLCEGRSVPGEAGWVAVGIGLNVRGPLPGEVAGRAVALGEVVPGATRTAVLQHLIPRLHRLEPRSRLTDPERAAFERHDWLAGRLIREPVKGRASGIDDDGALVVTGPSGRHRVTSGSVVTA
jgi:BirA family biotin operon repressor/biotin-[acetyl-CoA-carboxylase] ligase